MSSGSVRAAGGVVWRAGTDGETEVLLVHRPRYGDWSFPKGKRDDGESDEACALREVEEEAGLRCRLGAELASVSYLDDKGRSKLVRYWAMVPVDGAFVVNDEVDEVRWAPIPAARRMLTYGSDRDALDSLVV